MSSRKQRIPKYRLHKPTGQAVVRIDGNDIYLGRHGTTDSREKYDRVIAEWLVSGRTPPRPSDCGKPGRLAADLTVNELLLAYLRHGEEHFVSPDGMPTGELENFKDAIRPVKDLYGTTAAREFGPLALKAVRKRMLDAREYRVKTAGATGGKGRWLAEHRVNSDEGLARLVGNKWVQIEIIEQRQGTLSRGVVNARINRIRRLFRWAVSEELLPSAVYDALRSVTGLQKGRTKAREGKGVLPVALADVEATVPKMPPPIAAMVKVQLHTGCRVGEVLIVRTCDIDRSGPVWIYRPHRHKGKHKGRERVVLLGPKAQEAVLPFLLPDEPDAYIFSPVRWVAQQNAVKAAKRKTKRQPSHVLAVRCKPQPKRKPAAIYRRRSYRQAIRRACRRAGIALWNPLQLRHTAATDLRARYGVEAARTILGHSKVETSQLYAERDLGRAAEIMGEIG